MNAIQTMQKAYQDFGRMSTPKQMAVVAGVGTGISLVGGLGPHKIQQPSIGGTVSQAAVSGLMWGGINGGFALLQGAKGDQALKIGAKWAGVGAAFVGGRAIGHEIDNAVGL